MSTLHMVELQIDVEALLRFLRNQGLLSTYGDEDLGYAVHAWLAAAFDEMAPGPWRLLHDRRRPPRILGYSEYDGDQLQQRLIEFSEPSILAVCPNPEVMIVSRVMPSWRAGRRLGFEVQCCPVGRKARTGIEKDVFLIRADEAEEGDKLDRETVYRDWAVQQLQRGDAATVQSVELTGFRLVRQTRQTRPSTGVRRRQHLIRPLALLRGELVVQQPDGFSKLLARGVGRHRAFGYGMLLLRPPS